MNTKKFNTSWVPKGQHLYQIAPGAPGQPAQLRYQVLQKGITVVATLPTTLTTEGRVTIKLVRPADAASITAAHPAVPTNTGNPIPDDADCPPKPVQLHNNGYPASPAYYFPLDPNDRPCHFAADKKFVLWQYQSAFQALTIPIQYRPRLNEFTPAAATASFNIGVGWVHKFTKVTYRRINFPGTDQFLSHRIDNLSFSPGIFVAPTAVALTSTNTNGTLKNNTTVLGSTAGILGVVGYNDVNVGLAVGFDKIYGAYSSQWIYNGNVWVGLVFSIDFIK
jgi:hypothetical protein